MAIVRVEILVRICADALILNSSLLAALVLDYSRSGTQAPREQALLREYVAAHWLQFLLLTVITIAAFALSGVYTRGRKYQRLYKTVLVATTLSVAFGVFVVGQMMLSSPLPGPVLVITWVLSVVLVVSARLWADLWKVVLLKERDLEIPVKAGARQKHVLLIGGAGYIGSALLPQLIERGYRIRLLDLFLYGNEPVAKYLDHPAVEVMRADFRDVDKVVEAMAEIESVIHLGAIVGDPACAIDEELTIEVNLMATKMIAQVAKGNGINKFIFASTCSVYGASDEMLTETSRLNPVSLYARSKIASERVLLQMRSGTFTPLILRFGTIYGLSGRTRFDLVVNLLAAKAAIDGEITVFGADQWRPFLHVDDAVAAVVKALEAPRSDLREAIFNVGCEEQNFTLGQVGEMIHRLVPSARLIIGDSDSDRRNYRVGFERIKTVLGFRPKWTLENGIQQVLDSIARGEVVDYREPKYSNVQFLSTEARSERFRAHNGWEHELLAQDVSAAAELSSASNGSQPAYLTSKAA